MIEWTGTNRFLLVVYSVIAVLLVLYLGVLFARILPKTGQNSSKTEKSFGGDPEQRLNINSDAQIEVYSSEIPNKGKIVEGPYFVSSGLAVVGVEVTDQNGAKFIRSALLDLGLKDDELIFYRGSKMMQSMTFRLKSLRVVDNYSLPYFVWVIDR